MMNVFESMERDLDTTWKQNEILNDKLLEATLKYDVEKCVLMCSDFVNDNSNDEIEKFELQLQHQKERTKCEKSLNNLCENSWISKVEKLENENVYLEFKVQSLIKERENVKLKYQKLFDSIKKTRTQTQGEIHELIEHVNQKTYAYADVSAQNQDLLITISELKAKLKMLKKVRLKDATSVKRPLSRGSSSKNSVL
ncbi:hypothetical protein Tco_0005496 [Tanacetum coccineum]